MAPLWTLNMTGPRRIASIERQTGLVGNTTLTLALTIPKHFLQAASHMKKKDKLLAFIPHAVFNK